MSGSERIFCGHDILVLTGLARFQKFPTQFFTTPEVTTHRSVASADRLAPLLAWRRRLNRRVVRPSGRNGLHSSSADFLLDLRRAAQVGDHARISCRKLAPQTTSAVCRAAYRRQSTSDSFAAIKCSLAFSFVVRVGKRVSVSPTISTVLVAAMPLENQSATIGATSRVEAMGDAELT